MKIKGKNAISLIVLVITILVLSILAATVIISLSNANIISEASDAVKKTEAQQIEEAKSIMYADGILGNDPEDMTIGDYTLSWDSSKKEVVQKLGDYVIKESIIIPTGFYYVGGTKDTGLVISDNSADENKGVDYTCVGNQFVWVPVDDYSTFVSGEPEETFEGSGIYKMTGKLDGDFSEYLDYNSISESGAFKLMCSSVEKYKGFYVGRFEAGDGSATSPRTSSSGVGTVVSKKNAYVYNYVESVPGASQMGSGYKGDPEVLSINMYKDSTSVVSTLCYGVQWDAIMNFVSDSEHDIVNSRSWGNHFSIEELDAGASNSVEERIKTCGFSEDWKAKNIYDLAGNVTEWTMQVASYDGRFVRTARGSFAEVISGYSASGRHGGRVPSYDIFG